MKSSNTVLSIHYGHNATVGLIKDGKIVCLISEERLSRIKNATGFPVLAYKHVVEKYLDDNPNSIDLLVINDELLWGFDYLKNNGFEPHYYNDYYWKTRKNYIPDVFSENPDLYYSQQLSENLKLVKKSRNDFVRRSKVILEIATYTGISFQKIKILNHHEAHAYACLYWLDGERKHLIFTLDAEGDNVSASVSICTNGNLKKISTTHKFHSLGYLYREVTAFLGMKPDEHEFKVMGLAPYSSQESSTRVYNKLKEIIWIDEQLNFCSKIPLQDSQYYLLNALVYERFDSVAGGIQKLTEELVCEWISKWIAKENITSIALSGGVFMNVKACQKIASLSEVENIFVMPSSGDECLVLGGCYWGSKHLKVNKIEPIKDLYLGQQFSDSFIEDFLLEINARSRYNIEKLDDELMSDRVSELLANGEIVARCVGREEWGARALGNRSILANASNIDTIRKINQKIKSRDFWMPFTPSILSEDIDQYIVNPKNIFAPYMCITFDSTDKAKREITAALHPNDFTVRPQAVVKEWNSSYHKIISKFKSLTGVSGILNTSFNLHGHPNVNSPRDAVYTIDNSGLNYLVLGSFLLEKLKSKE